MHHFIEWNVNCCHHHIHSKQGIARAGRANLGLIRSTKTFDFGNLQYRIITEGEIEAFRTFADLLDSADSTPRDDHDNETNSFRFCASTRLTFFHYFDSVSTPFTSISTASHVFSNSGDSHTSQYDGGRPQQQQPGVAGPSASPCG